MNTQNIRFFLFAVLIMLGMLFYDLWHQENPTTPLSKTTLSAKAEAVSETDIPEVLENKDNLPEPIRPSTHKPISVKTDVFDLKIDSLGGDIVQLNLSQYAENADTFGQGFVLLDQSDQRYYIAQSGLASELGPDKRGKGRAQFEASQAAYELLPNQNQLVVELKHPTSMGLDFIKRFVFERGSYVIKVEYHIQNKGTVEYKGNLYARLKRKPAPEKKGGFLGVQTFTGAAIHTSETPYKKLPFKDIKRKPLEHTVEGGFAAMVEHYFVGAWVPNPEAKSTYQISETSDHLYSVGWVEPSVTVQPGEEKTLTAQLYLGPQIESDLKALSPGLELAADYGILRPICQPILWLLKQAFQFTHNWGVAIILTTILIKALFYRLSARSFRSMGAMRKLQPRIEALKAKHGEDKQQFSQALMALYRTEKINPLGGCLPIVVQIPVFIALYYVLLNSVELREAPFIFWIKDLSAKDPFYVLPILNGLSMVLQQKLNPAATDPMQAKVMMLMPAVFTVLFLNFPAGLVLYWFVNSMLSIAQQWLITRKIEGSVKPHGAQ